jgi:cell fate regulator YaaT (PSP1 superfamily)
MREGTHSFEGRPGTDRPGGRVGAAPGGRKLPPGADQISGARDEARRAKIRTTCLRQFASGGLSLQFVDVEVDGGRRAATVFFTSEAKVDFRQLCRALSRELRMRVTLHRLGPRDLAKRAGTCGPCGRPLCCRSFLSGFPSVSVKQVKEQKFPLTPERSAGMCGRLKCCLAFERGEAACHRAGCGCSVEAATGDTGSDSRIPNS